MATLDYVPDVNNVSEPTDDRSAGYGNEELRLIKQRLATLTGNVFAQGSVPANAVVYGPRYKYGDKSYSTTSAIDETVNKSLHYKTPNFLSILTSPVDTLRLSATAGSPVYVSARNGFTNSGFNEHLIKRDTNLDLVIPANMAPLSGLYPVILAKTNAARTALDSLMLTHARPVVAEDWPKACMYLLDRIDTVAPAGSTSLFDYFGNPVLAGSTAVNTATKLDGGVTWLWSSGAAVGYDWLIGQSYDEQTVFAGRNFEVGFTWKTDGTVNATATAKLLFSLGTGANGILSLGVDGSKFRLYAANEADAGDVTNTQGATTVVTATEYKIRIVKVANVIRLYVNGALELTHTIKKINFDLAAGVTIRLGGPGVTLTAHVNSYWKDFYAAPHFVGDGPGSYSNLDWIERPLFVDRITGQTYQVTAKAASVVAYPTLTEVDYSIIPLGYYTKPDVGTAALPLQLPFGFSLLKPELEISASATSWDYLSNTTYAKFSVSTEALGIGAVGIGLYTAAEARYAMFTYLYPSNGKNAKKADSKAYNSAGVTSMFASIVHSGPDHFTGNATNSTPAAVASYRMTHSAVQTLF